MTVINQVWVVDDDRSIRWVLGRALKGAGIACQEFESGQEVVNAIQSQQPRVIITDVRMPGMDGFELLRHLNDAVPDLPVIITTAHAGLENAVSAFQSGAFEYLPKPFDIDDAIELVEKALNQSNQPEPQPPAEIQGTSEIIGSAPLMQEVFRAIGRLSKSSINVLITGESGTGKELVASALHRHSPRGNGPFIALNMAAITRELLESELFGHEKGAFTSAHKQRIGKFEQANGGTLFLDEIGDMSLSAQAKVLRALQESRITRVGGDKEISVDVRVVAATNKDLRKEIEEGRFREDLYHRLAVIIIRVPSLNDRKDDIPTLARHFVKQVCQEYGVPAKPIAPSALERLKDVNWTGNIRELRNAIERLVILSKDRISEGDVEHYVLPTSAEPSQKLKDIFARFESKEALLDFIDEQFAVYQKA